MSAAVLNIEDIRECLIELYPPAVKSFAATKVPDDFVLHENEAAHTTGMVEKRRDEFLLGRYCARRALRSAGLTVAPVGKGTERQPLWPTGAVGSISHTQGIAAAVAASAHSFRAVGLDIESDEPLTADILQMTCLPIENAENDGSKGKLLFSIKESIFKCIHPVLHTYVDFLDMQVHIDRDRNSWAATSQTHKCPAELANQLTGRWSVRNGLVISSAWLANADH